MAIKVRVPAYVSKRESLGYRQATATLHGTAPPQASDQARGYTKWLKRLRDVGVGVQVAGETVEPLTPAGTYLDPSGQPVSLDPSKLIGGRVPEGYTFVGRQTPETAARVEKYLTEREELEKEQKFIEVFKRPPVEPEPVRPPAPPVTKTYEHIITKERISAREPPSKAWIEPPPFRIREVPPVRPKERVVREREVMEFKTEAKATEAEAMITLSSAMKEAKETRLPTYEELKEIYPAVVTPYERPKGLEALRLRIGEAGERVFIAKARKEKVPIKERAISVIGEAAVPFITTAALAKALVKEPVETTKAVAKESKEFGKKIITGAGFPEVGRFVREKPEAVTARVIGEVALMKGLGRAVRAASRGVEIARTRISPKYRPVIAEARREIIRVPSKVPKKVVKIEIAKPVSQITEPLSKQVRLAGKEVTAVSAARDLFKPLKRRVIIRKPTPTPKPPKLERALFADPYARLRISRLGVLPQKEARLLDILSGDVTFRRARPQALIFEKVKVAKFPRILKPIETKLRIGRPLTVRELARLERWQLKPARRFKPIGFPTREPEIILAPGEIIRKVKTPAVTLIKRRRVPIIRAEIVTPTKPTRRLLMKPELTAREMKELTKRLTKETKIDISRVIETRPYISPVKVVSPLLSISRAVKGISQGISPVIRRPVPVRRIKRIPRPRDYLPPSIRRVITRLDIVSPAPRVPVRRPPVELLRPIIPIPVPPILDIEPAKLKKRKIKKFKFKEPKLYVAGFSARLLGIKAAFSPAQLRKLTSMPSFGLALRPMIVRRRK